MRSSAGRVERAYNTGIIPVISVLLFVFAAECVALKTKPHFGAVEIIAMDLTGAPVPKAKVTFYAPQLEKVKAADSNQLPYGD